MDIHEIIKKRRSVRSFRDDPVPDESLQKIYDAIRFAPSAHNAQDYKFIFVEDKEKKELLIKAANQRFMSSAPIIIAGVSLSPDYIMDSDVPAYGVDTAIALDHISLAAVGEGLGTCWIGSFNQEEVKNILNIPADYKVVALMLLGYPYDEEKPKSRKKVDALVCKDIFSK